MIARNWLAIALAVGMVVCGATGRAVAQDSASPKATAAPQAQSQPQPLLHSYRLDFSINELEDGKRVNSRQYSMDINSTGKTDGRIQAGTRVPVVVKADGTVDYLDVSTQITVSHLAEHDNGISLDFGSSIQSPAPSENPDSPGRWPVLRNLGMNGSAILTIGKATVISVADDPNSKRQFQLEVTATQLK